MLFWYQKDILKKLPQWIGEVQIGVGNFNVEFEVEGFAVQIEFYQKKLHLKIRSSLIILARMSDQKE